jgi:hypothetical protein
MRGTGGGIMGKGGEKGGGKGGGNEGKKRKECTIRERRPGMRGKRIASRRNEGIEGRAGMEIKRRKRNFVRGG